VLDGLELLGGVGQGLEGCAGDELAAILLAGWLGHQNLACHLWLHCTKGGTINCRSMHAFHGFQAASVSSGQTKDIRHKHVLYIKLHPLPFTVLKVKLLPLPSISFHLLSPLLTFHLAGHLKAAFGDIHADMMRKGHSE
jgi:hypothetical protein